MKYRSRTDIAAEILKVAMDGISKTRLMYGAYISYKQLGGYLDALIANGMLAFDRRLNSYKTTAKGLEFYQTYEKMGIFKNPQ